MGKVFHQSDYYCNRCILHHTYKMKRTKFVFWEFVCDAFLQSPAMCIVDKMLPHPLLHSWFAPIDIHKLSTDHCRYFYPHTPQNPCICNPHTGWKIGQCIRSWQSNFNLTWHIWFYPTYCILRYVRNPAPTVPMFCKRSRVRQYSRRIK